MYYNKYIISEAIKLNSVEDVISAIKTNSAGVRVNPKFKQETQEDYISEKLSKYFKRCENFNVKDATYGVQLLLQKSEPTRLEDLIRSDGLYIFLNSYKKPWVKELKEYKELISANSWTPQLLHSFEKIVQSEQSNHGKKSKGSGDLKDVKTAYDDGVWKLLIPSSFEGEKAAAFYTDKNGKEVPTEWCTRADKSYYDHYTTLGPLYIIRNMKNGKSYQIAFTKSGIDFLDQNDVDGDEVTGGDLTAIPDNLLKLIKDHRGSRTLYDFKHRKEDKDENKPSKFFKGRILSTDAVYASPLSPKIKLGPAVSLGNGIYKKEILNYSTDADTKTEFEKFFYFKNNEYTKIPLKFVKRNKATIYYPKDNPKAIYAIYTDTDNNNKTVLFGSLTETSQFGKLDEKTKNLIHKLGDKDFGIDKHDQREKAAKDESFVGLNHKLKEALENEKNKIIDTINNSNVFLSNKSYKSLVDFGYKGFSSRTGDGGVAPDVIKLTNNKNKIVAVLFRDSYLKSNNATIIVGNQKPRYHITKNGDRVLVGQSEATKEELTFFKKVCQEIMKQIIKLPEFKALNEFRKQTKTKKDYNHYIDTKGEYDPDWDGEEFDTKRQYTRKIKRDADKYSRKKHEVVAFEEVKYFNY